MRLRPVLWGAVWLVLAAVLPGGRVAARLPQSSSYSQNLSPADVIDAVNSLRSAHGLPPYTVSSILMGTAQGQADFMAQTGTIQHTGPGGSTVTQRLLAAGYPLAGDLSLGGFRSENIVGGYGMTAQDAVNAWTGDAPHLNTMLSPDLQEIGAGVAESDGMTYYVIDCARPTSGGVPVAYTPGAEANLSGGNDIIIPVKLATPNANGDIIHEVQQGQSLWSIAIAYGVHIVEIQRLNNMGQYTTIQRGDKLLIRRIGTATPAPPTSTATETGMPTEPAQSVAPVDVASPTLIVIPSATPSPYISSSMTGGGAVIGIIVAALVASGLVAWLGRKKPDLE
jgi:uncharacterized protein YkwD/LysM repeat protein